MIKQLTDFFGLADLIKNKPLTAVIFGLCVAVAYFHVEGKSRQADLKKELTERDRAIELKDSLIAICWGQKVELVERERAFFEDFYKQTTAQILEAKRDAIKNAKQ